MSTGVALVARRACSSAPRSRLRPRGPGGDGTEVDPGIAPRTPSPPIDRHVLPRERRARYDRIRVTAGPGVSVCGGTGEIVTSTPPHVPDESIGVPRAGKP